MQHCIFAMIAAIPLLAAVEPGPAPATPAANLVVNGDFTAGWTNWAPHENDKGSGTAALQSEDGNTYLHLASPTQVLLSARIAINPTWKRLTISCRMRLSGFVANPEITYGNARLANSFVLPEGKRAYLGILQLSADTDPAKDGGWVTLKGVAEVPEGALEYEVACGNFATAGQTDFDDLVVTAE